MSANVSLLRRDVLKGVGALVVSFNLGFDGGSNGAAAAEAPALRDPKVANSWIAIGKDNTATVYLGKVELGQGNSTTLLQLVAEELDLDLKHVSAAAVDTNHSMNSRSDRLEFVDPACGTSIARRGGGNPSGVVASSVGEIRCPCGSTLCGRWRD